MGNSSGHSETDMVGYRVLGVQPNSPASMIGLVSFFDFIVAADNIPLKTLDSTFIDIIKAFENKQLTLTVYNTKCKKVRNVCLTPSRNWNGGNLITHFKYAYSVKLINI